MSINLGEITSDGKVKLAKKIGDAMLSAFDKLILCVGCKYHVTGIEESQKIQQAE